MAAALADLGVPTEEEVVIKEGYSIDALVLWEGRLGAVEVEGVRHRLREHRVIDVDGATLLKRRQLRALGWRLIIVPHEEWGKVQGVEAKRRQYLTNLLQTTML